MAATDPALQYTTYPSFSTGIVSNIRQQSTTSPTTPGYFFAPLGTAAEGTVRCVANDTGDLVPAPAQDSGASLSETLNANGDFYRYVGLTSWGPATPSSGSYAHFTGYDAIYWAVEYNTGSGTTFNRNMASWVYKNYLNTVSPYTLPVRTGHTHNPAVNMLNIHGMTYGITRARATNYSFPGHPTIFMEWAEPLYFENATPVYFGWTIPDPSNVGTNSELDLTFPTPGPIQTFAHQGREIFLQSGAAAGLNDLLANTAYLTNENVLYTDPPNSVTIASPSILDPQYPGGYGSWGSISFGELLLIKRSGGALLIDGDIYAPTITRLPGIQATGVVRGAGVPTKNGLVYCCEDGAYIWDGSSTSQKLNKINDTFFVRHDGSGNLIQGPDGVNVQLCSWGQYVVFPNNWLYDTVNDAWWQLEDPAVYNIALCCSSQSSTAWFYSVPDSVTGAAGAVTMTVARWSRYAYAPSYKWVGQPYQATINRRIDIREVIMTLANIPAAGATVTITFVCDNATTPSTQTITWDIAPGSTYPVTLRQTTSFQADFIAPIITVASIDGTSPAPTIPKGGLTIAWLEAEPFAAELVPE